MNKFLLYMFSCFVRAPLALGALIVFALILGFLQGCGDTIIIYPSYDAGPSVTDGGTPDGPVADLGVDAGPCVPLPRETYNVLSNTCGGLFTDMFVRINDTNMSTCTANYDIYGLPRDSSLMAPGFACGEATDGTIDQVWPTANVSCSYPWTDRRLEVSLTCTLSVESETRIVMACRYVSTLESGLCSIILKR